MNSSNFCTLFKEQSYRNDPSRQGSANWAKKSLLQLLNLAVAVWKQTQTSHKKWVWLHANKTLFIKTGCGFHLVSRLYFVKLCFKLSLFKVKWLFISPLASIPRKPWTHQETPQEHSRPVCSVFFLAGGPWSFRN